jgi:hypothetical protein
MLISQTVNFLNIHENLHRLIMEIKLSTQLFRSNEAVENPTIPPDGGYLGLQHGHFDLDNHV